MWCSLLCFITAEASSASTSGSQDAVSAPAGQPPVQLEGFRESAASAQVPEPQPQTAAPSGAATEQSAAQTPALPVADMQALAKRIGKAKPPPAQPSKHGLDVITVPDPTQGTWPPQAVRPSGPTPTVYAPGAVPSEIQAIIQKLVHFIKVGPAGHVRPPQRLLVRCLAMPAANLEAD